MIDTSTVAPRPYRRGIVTTCTPRRLLARGLVVALPIGLAAGCGARFAGVDPDTSEGEAIVAALDHVVATKWNDASLSNGKTAIAYDGEEPLSESTRSLLDEALAARGWHWSAGDPLVPTGDCAFPGGDCRLKEPVELHMTFSVGTAIEMRQDEAVPPPPPPDGFYVEPGDLEGRHDVHVRYISGYYSERLGRNQAYMAGFGMLVTRGTDGWVVKVVMQWIT